MVVGVAMFYVAFYADYMPADGQKGFKNTPKAWLMAALAFSLLGDAWLMFEGFFIQGLLSFLLGHLCFIAMYRQGVRWFPSKGALLLTGSAGALMYATLWPHLPVTLKIPVAIYVAVIALMSAQALGRASVHKTPESRWVAAGALLFMCSDSLLAWNKFVSPLPLSQLWVLGTYFAAQLLMVRFVMLPASKP
jgi:alkylglycerol monooxygenase